MAYGIIEQAGGSRGPIVKSRHSTLEEGRAWIREERTKSATRDTRPTQHETGSYGLIEHARKDRGPEGRDTRSILEEGRAWIREHKGDVEYELRKLDEEDRDLEARLARMTPDMVRLRREMEQEELDAGELFERIDRTERMRTLPATEHESRDAIAYHEAAHAVVGFIEGSGVESVSIEVQARNAVGGLYRPRRGTLSARCYMAGYEGTELAGLDHVLRRNKESSDYRAAKRTGADLDRAERDARELLRTHWKAVRALATELAWAGEVQGDEAERIIADALKAR